MPQLEGGCGGNVWSVGVERIYGRIVWIIFPDNPNRLMRCWSGFHGNKLCMFRVPPQPALLPGVFCCCWLVKQFSP